MNRIILLPEEITNPSEVVVEDSHRWTHLRDIIKVKVGTSIKVCVLGVGLTSATILCCEQTRGLLRIEDDHIEKGAEPWLSLYFGLCRPPTMQKVFEHGTAMGIGDYHLIQGELSEKSYWKSKLIQKSFYQKYLNLGLSQSLIYYQLPCLHTYRGLRDLQIENGNGSKFFLDRDASKLFTDNPINWGEKISFAVGPERGWTEAERDYFLEAGFTPVRISSAILRVEHAIFHSVGQLELCRLKEGRK